MFVSWLTIVTLASGTLAPEESTTVPFTTAVGVCANSAPANRAIAVKLVRMFNLLVD